MNTDEKRAFLLNHCKTLARALEAQGAYTAGSSLSCAVDGMMDYKIEDIFRAVFDGAAQDDRIARMLDVSRAQVVWDRENLEALGAQGTRLSYTANMYWSDRHKISKSVHEKMKSIALMGMACRQWQPIRDVPRDGRVVLIERDMWSQTDISLAFWHDGQNTPCLVHKDSGQAVNLDIYTVYAEVPTRIPFEFDGRMVYDEREPA